MPSSCSFFSPLLTDLYQLTMAFGYFQTGIAEKEAVFHLFFRKNPFQGGFTVAAGLEAALEYFENFSFSEEDLKFLKSLKDEKKQRLFPDPFLEELRRFKFRCDVDAVPEGTVVFPFEPLLRIRGPLLQAQIFETALLNLMNFPSLIATKAARICLAAEGDRVLEYGLRRAQGPDGALTASRAAFIGGCFATSNVLAGQRFGIPLRGTHAHSWIMGFPHEKMAFETYGKLFPDSSIFLVDTYDTKQGVENAIAVAKDMKKRGSNLLGIRLDSGDLAYLSRMARDLLDKAGLPEVKILASNELDEIIISDLKKQGAAIDIWGVGTSLVTGKTQSALDGVYKMSALEKEDGKLEYKIKISEQINKITNPGILQVKRFFNDKEYVADVIYDLSLGMGAKAGFIDPLDPTKQKRSKGNFKEKELLIPVFRKGKRVYHSPSLKEIQAFCKKELSHFHSGIKRFLYPHPYVVGMEEKLYNRKWNLIQKLRQQTQHPYLC